MRFLLIISIILIFSGCTTIGNKFDPESINLLTPSISTMNDATSLLGPPMSESTLPNGNTLYQWMYSQGTLIGGSAAHLAIVFDSKGKMLKIQHMSNTKS